VELFFGLIGGSSSNATVTIDAMRFYQQTAPRLSISLGGNQAVISWPLGAQGYVLQSTTNPSQADQWTNVTNTPAASGLWNSVTNPIIDQTRFYRLKK